MSHAFRELHWANDFPVRDYHLASSLSEALEILERYRGRARIIAGGTDLVPELRRREVDLEALVDISRIAGLNSIEQQGDDILLGGLVTHAQVAGSALVRERAGLLADGAAAVGSPQIRNVGTVAGNLVSGRPAADTSIPLLALEAVVTIASAAGERRVPLSDFFTGTGKTVLDPSGEILTQIRFRGLGVNRGGSYLRLSKRKALTLPILVTAAVVAVDPDQRVIREAAVALGPVAPIPFRATPCETLLRGAPLDRELIRQAAEAAVQECRPRDSLLRGSCDYRQEMVPVLIRRSIQKALEQAGFPLAT